MTIAYAIVIDQIYQVEGRIVDDELCVYKCPQGAGLNGSLFHKWAWCITIDHAYYLLELSLKKTLEQWKRYAETYLQEQRTVDLEFANKQIAAFEDLIPKARLFDPSFLRRMT